jgi:opacity protein-like surface antigen
MNHFIIDKQYQTDYQYKNRWGVTMGVMGQYDITDWAGVRVELDWTQKNYRQKRENLQVCDYKYVNNYLQLPIMGSFSFGGEKLRGFCNLGIYTGYWLNCNRKGTDTNFLTNLSYDFSEKVEFMDERDQRWDFGFVGGAGLEYRFARHWAAQVELRYYYSTVSTVKVNDHAKDYRYNSTMALQAGIWYRF